MTRSFYGYLVNICPCDLGLRWNWPISGALCFTNTSCCNVVIISPWKRAGSFIWTNLNPLHPSPKDACAKFGSNCPSGSGEEDENVKSLRKQRQRQQTNFDQKSSLEPSARMSYKTTILWVMHGNRLCRGCVPLFHSIILPRKSELHNVWTGTRNLILHLIGKTSFLHLPLKFTRINCSNLLAQSDQETLYVIYSYWNGNVRQNCF